MYAQLTLPGFADVRIVSSPSHRDATQRRSAPAPTSLTPYECSVLLRELRTFNRWRQGPVKTPVLAGCLGISERTARHYLARMEQAGLVHRPAGPRSGWAVRV